MAQHAQGPLQAYRSRHCDRGPGVGEEIHQRTKSGQDAAEVERCFQAITRSRDISELPPPYLLSNPVTAS